LGNFSVTNIDYVFVTFSMCLFSISAISFLLIGQNTYPQLWKRLMVFTALLGIYSITELFSLAPGVVCGLFRPELLTLIIAFLFLFDYGRSETAKRIKNKKLLGIWIYSIPLIALIIYIASLRGLSIHSKQLPAAAIIMAFTRYIFGFLGGLWAFYIIFTAPEYKTQKMSVRWPYIFIAFFIAAFALTQIFPAPADIFPANILNTESFLRVTGFHIQLLRVVIMLSLLATIFVGFRLVNLPKRIKTQIITTFLFLLIAGFFVMVMMGTSAKAHLREALSEKVRTAAASINYRRIVTLKGSLQDIGTPDFDRMKEVLVQIRKVNPECRFAYLIGKRNDKIFFYMDSEPPSSKDYSAPGSLWEKYPPGALTALSKGVDTVDGPYTDEWGTWISGFSPIKDLGTGNIVAVFSFDIDARVWQAYILKERSEGAIIVLAIFFVLLLLLLLAGARKASEKELSELQEKFERAFNASQTMNIITLMKTGQVIDVNNSFLETFEYKRNEIIGRSTLDLSIYQDADARAAIIKELEEKGSVTGKELRGKAKSGRTIFALMSASVMTVKGSKYVISSISDVTTLKKTQDDLIAKNLMLSTQQDVTLDGILSVDEQGKIISFNQKFIDLWGVSADAIATGSDEPVLRSVVDKVANPAEFLYKVKYLYESKHEKSHEEILLVDGRTFDRYSAPMFTDGKYYGRVWFFRDISAEKKLELTLMKDEEYFRTVMNSIQAGIAIVDTETFTIVDANPAAAEILRVPREKLIGSSCKDYICKKDCDRCPVIQEKMVVANKEVEMNAGGGTTIPVLKTVTEVMFRGKKHLLETFIDITERKKNEEALRTSEVRYKAIFESSHDAIMLLAPEKGFFRGNAATIKLFRCKNNEEFESMTPVDLSPEYQPDGALSSVKAPQMVAIAIKNGSHFFEWTHKKKDGEEFFATVLLTRFELEGKLILQATVRDVSESKMLEQELKDAMAHLQNTQHIAHLGSIDVDLENGMATWSDEACKIFGVEVTDCHVSFEGFMKLVHPDDRERVKLDWEKMLSSAAPVETEAKHIMPKTGEVRYFLTSLQKIEKDGKQRVSGSTLDVTDIKRAEEEIKRISKVKDEFLSITSHDLKSPLGIVKTSMGLLLEELNLTDTVKGYAELSLRQSNKGLKLISDLLDLKKLESGNVKLEISRFSVSHLINEVIKDLKTACGQKGIELKAIMDGNYEVSADYGRLVQVLTNLVGNSQKFTPKGGTITIHASKMDDKLKIDIVDTGEGIPHDKLSQIFERYGQAKSSDKKIGTGLGLTITRYLCELHGGDISVSSELGKGSTFSFTIPRVSIASDTKVTVPIIRKTVLIVDDEADSRSSTRLLLERNDHFVTEATTSKDALDKVRHNKVDAVILDLEMPDMNGWDLLELIRLEKSKKELPVIIYSSNVDEEQFNRNIGANDFVNKSEGAKILIEKINRLLKD
jgi:PAS domain S-box-containing protein